MVEPSARFESIKIALPEPVHGLSEVSAVLGIPRWWPTGSRVSVVIAHGAGGSYEEGVVEHVHRELTERRYLCLRVNFPFAEAQKKRPDSMAVLRRTLRAAVSTLARDPTAAPAHLFLGGRGLGAQVACELAGARLRVDGLFLLGYPLHPMRKPEKVSAEQLYRIVSPVFVAQGTRDRHADLEVLRRTLTRVGAPTTLLVSEEADHVFKVLKRSPRSQEEVYDELVAGLDAWIQKVLGA